MIFNYEYQERMIGGEKTEIKNIKINNFLLFLIYFYMVFCSFLLDFSLSGLKIISNNTKVFMKFNSIIFISLNVFLIFNFIAYLIIMAFIHYSLVYKMIKIFVLFIIILIYFLLNNLIIFKLYATYKIIQKFIWVMIYDYLIIIATFIFMAIIAYIIYLYSKSSMNYSKIFILIKFYNIKIKDFILPKDFNMKKDSKKKEIILDNIDKYKFQITDNQAFLLFSINQLRYKNNIDRFKFETSVKIRFILLNEISELKFLKYKHIFKIFGENYLFIYNLNEFKKKLIQKEAYIRNVVLNEQLTNIIIFEQENLQYIFIYNPSSFSEYKIINDLKENKINNSGINDSFIQSNIIINSENQYFQ